jgi:hypothetical protein
VHDDIWLVSFMDYGLGYFDLETRVLEPLENPFGPKVLPIAHPSGETVGNRYTCRLIEFTVQINPFLRESPVAGEA